MIDRIKKLLRLANDKAASPAEAANAMKRALQLAEEEGITLDQIDPNEDDFAGILTHQSAEFRGIGTAEILSMHLVCHYFHVEHLIDRSGRKPAIHFVGSRSACDLAVYVHNYLSKAMRQAWANNTDRRLKRDSFMRGFAHAIERQMPKVFHDDALVPACTEYIQAALLNPGESIKTSTPKSKPLALVSFNQGFKKGNEAGIRNGLDQQNPQLKGGQA